MTSPSQQNRDAIIAGLSSYLEATNLVRAELTNQLRELDQQANTLQQHIAEFQAMQGGYAVE